MSPVLTPRLTIAVCCFNAAPRLHAVLQALARQRVSGDLGFETLLVDNRSTDGTAAAAAAAAARLGLPLRIVAEPAPGLTRARRRAALEARGDILSYVDDDNLVAPDWVEQCVRFMDEHPGAGIIGGVVEPIFEDPATCPPDFLQRYAPALAIRGGGEQPLRHTGEQEPPCGAGMTIRTALARTLLCDIGLHLGDRRGKHLSAGGDTEMGLLARRLGFETWYAPGLRLGHVLPPGRLTPEYLRRLENGFARAHTWLEALLRDAPLPSRFACATRALREFSDAARMAFLAALRRSGHPDSARYGVWARRMYVEGLNCVLLALDGPMVRIAHYQRRRRTDPRLAAERGGPCALTLAGGAWSPRP
jgi:GT2 family glycosyltransferase